MNQTNPNRNLVLADTVLWTALVTPMHSDGTIDFDTLIQLAQRQAEAGNGITLLGSTGEGLALTVEEHFAVVKHVTNLKLNVPVMVAVGGYNLAAQLNWLEKCNQLPVDAYLLATPIYAKPGIVGLTQWFSALLEQANFPCMIYNVPSRSGVNIPVATMQNIQHHPKCWAMKEASGELETFLSYRQHCPELALFSGEDAMMPYLAGADVKGLVSVAANVWPEATQAYVKQALSGDHQGLFPLWHNAINALFEVTSPIPTKVLMAEKGLLTSATLRAPLTEQELGANHQLLALDQKIQQWFNQNYQQSSIQNQQIIGVNQ